MQAIVIEKTGSFVVRDIKMPEPGPDEVLLKVTVTGLSRTDLKLIRDGHRYLKPPRIPGKEIAGTIVSVGSKVQGLYKGRRASLYPGKSCKSCDMCRSGIENLCRSMEIMGFQRRGGFTQYIAVPAESVILVPESITDKEAAFAEPLACCMNALELADLQKGETLGIWIEEPEETLLSRAALARKATPRIMDTEDTRSPRSGGVSSPSTVLFDVCIVAAGNIQSCRKASFRLKSGGRLVVFSDLPPGFSENVAYMKELRYREQTIIGAYGSSLRHEIEALKAIADGSVPVKDLISHSIPLSELNTALSLLEDRTCMKIHLYPEEQE